MLRHFSPARGCEDGARIAVARPRHGKNYTTADLHAKVTGTAKYAEDFRAEGMLFCKLLLSPLPHARVRRIDASRALAMPGVKAMLTADELPAPADNITDRSRHKRPLAERFRLHAPPSADH